MCRVAGRRCPCDTSEARQARRVAAGLKSQISGQIGQLQQSSVGVITTPEREISVEDVKASTAALQETRDDLAVVYGKTTPDTDFREELEKISEKHNIPVPELQQKLLQKYEVQVREVGAEIAELAEQRGTPETAEALEEQARAGVDQETLNRLESGLARDSETIRTDTTAIAEDLQNLTEDLEYRDYTGHLPLDAFVLMQNFSKFNNPSTSDRERRDIAFGVYTRTGNWVRKMEEQYGKDSVEHQQAVAYKERFQNFQDTWQKKLEADRNINELLKTKQNQILEQRGETYQQILAEVSGEEYGGDVFVESKSHKREVAVIQEAAKIFPKRWVDKSNEASNTLRVKKTTARAHYAGLRGQKKYETVPMKRVHIFENDEQRENAMRPASWGNSLAHTEWREANAEEKESAHAALHEQVFVKEEFDYAHNKRTKWGTNELIVDNYGEVKTDFEKPRGKDWEPVSFNYKLSTYANGQSTTKEYTVNSWRKVRSKRNLVGMDYQAELLVDNDTVQGSTKPNGYNTALHELTHRMEDVSGSHISRLQRTFLQRRATSEDGESEELDKIYKHASKGSKMSKEVGYKDSFVDHYMGKVYNNTRHYEVMSTGVEAVFAGRFGGFIGAEGRVADHDHRNFVLGALASG